MDWNVARETLDLFRDINDFFGARDEAGLNNAIRERLQKAHDIGSKSVDAEDDTKDVEALITRLDNEDNWGDSRIHAPLWAAIEDTKVMLRSLSQDLAAAKLRGDLFEAAQSGAIKRAVNAESEKADPQHGSCAEDEEGRTVCMAVMKLEQKWNAVERERDEAREELTEERKFRQKLVEKETEHLNEQLAEAHNNRVQDQAMILNQQEEIADLKQRTKETDDDR